MPGLSVARTAVVIPGRTQGPYAPPLAYAAEAAAARRARVSALEWTPPPEFDPALKPAGTAQAAWVRGQISPVLDDLAALGALPLLIGRSLGSYASLLAAERNLPAIWLTPLLTDADVAAGLRACRAPFLLVGGSADRTAWDGALARYLTPHVCELADADHGLFVPGPLAASAAGLGQVATAVERFLDQVVWPR